VSLICPHCSKKAFSVARLLCLGPARSARCQSCGFQLSVGWLVFVPFLIIFSHLPVVAAFASLFYVGSALGGFAAFAASLAAGLLVGAPLAWVYSRLVQFVPAKQRSV